jgi:hypothetical protein
VAASGWTDLVLSAGPFAEELKSHLADLERLVFIGHTEGLPPAFFEHLPKHPATIRALITPHALAALAEELPALPLYWKPVIAAVDASLRGYILHPLDPFWRAENWWLAVER